MSSSASETNITGQDREGRMHGKWDTMTQGQQVDRLHRTLLLGVIEPKFPGDKSEKVSPSAGRGLGQEDGLLVPWDTLSEAQSEVVIWKSC